jgi:hypothetical protein
VVGVGMAVGVGSSPILGRIHQAPLKVCRRKGQGRREERGARRGETEQGRRITDRSRLKGVCGGHGGGVGQFTNPGTH